MEDLIAAMSAAARLGTPIYIRSDPSKAFIRIDIGGAMETVTPSAIVNMLSPLEGLARHGKLYITQTAATRISKWARKWGGPERQRLAMRVRGLPHAQLNTLGTVSGRLSSKTANSGVPRIGDAHLAGTVFYGIDFSTVEYMIVERFSIDGPTRKSQPRVAQATTHGTKQTSTRHPPSHRERRRHECEASHNAQGACERSRCVRQASGRRRFHHI